MSRKKAAADSLPKPGVAKRGGKRQPATDRQPALTPTVTVLTIDADFDEATTEVFRYREQRLYPALEQRGLQLRRCAGQLATRVYVEQAGLDPAVKMILGSGHGHFDEFTGYFSARLYRIGNYDAREVRGRVVHLLACQTGARLGPEMVQRGCAAFFGYDVNFTWPTSEGEMFFECDAELDCALAEGLTAEQAYRRAAQMFQPRIDELRAPGTDEAILRGSILENNFAHLCAPSRDARWGDVNARLE